MTKIILATRKHKNDWIRKIAHMPDWVVKMGFLHLVLKSYNTRSKLSDVSILL